VLVSRWGNILESIELFYKKMKFFYWKISWSASNIGKYVQEYSLCTCIFIVIKKAQAWPTHKTCATKLAPTRNILRLKEIID